ncbi:type IV pilus secretin PilQ [Halomonas sp. I1]|uniref:type IV pilus secretin PilQ n=1 Tax=Halomonas sp. I1 TaxID=393536 RepID=UPI0028DEB7E3|nr:type IV pilus secretin PilQ [Halomonas sp. I1]MDT8894441.1 type IV pilus secretin PilQ [Halomonas sp. I1]
MARTRSGAVSAVVPVMMVVAVLACQVWAKEGGDDGVPPISLNLRDVSIRTALAAIADVTDLNLVASDGVSGRVTLNLEEVPWQQALALILESHGLASRRRGNVIMVAPVEELTRRGSAEAGAGHIMPESPLVTEHLRIKYAKAADLAGMLRGEKGVGLLTKRGRVAVDVRTNTLVIQDTAERIAAVQRMLARLDVAVRQVRIEARIVIARDSVARELGVDWGLSVGEGGTPNGLNARGASSGVAERGGLTVDLGSARSPATTFGFGYLSGDVLLDLELRALESEGKSRIISQPRVITANQGTALIKQGTEIPYQEATSSGATNVEFKEAVLSLEVTPQITPDDRIIMELAINNDTVAQETFGGAPAIDTNQIATQVLVDDGDTVVLGGILTTEQVHQLFKTPLLGDLPLIGHLFRYTENSSDKVELLVFITPRILDDNLATH